MFATDGKSCSRTETRPELSPHRASSAGMPWRVWVDRVVGDVDLHAAFVSCHTHVAHTWHRTKRPQKSPRADELESGVEVDLVLDPLADLEILGDQGADAGCELRQVRSGLLGGRRPEVFPANDEHRGPTKLRVLAHRAHEVDALTTNCAGVEDHDLRIDLADAGNHGGAI